MSIQTVDVTALAGLFALLATLVMQFAKPLIEAAFPALLVSKNQQAHDGLLRLLLGLLNFGLLLLAATTVPVTFAGWQWFDLLALAFGQAIVSHVAYVTTTAGKVDAPTA